MKAALRILHLVTTLDVGGAEMHLLKQVRGQVERGCSLRVAFLKGAGSLAGDFRAAGAEAVVSTRLSPLALWPHLRWAEIVHTHLLKADAWGAVWAALAGRRRGLVSSKHNDERALLSLPVSLAHGLLGRLPRRTIVLSDHVGGFIERHGRIPRRRITRIYYGVDPGPFESAAGWSPAERARARAELGLGACDYVVLCVARFAPQKAHDVLLAAFARVRQRLGDAPAVLLLAGDDPFGAGRERAERLARELDLGAGVRFLGIRRDVARLYALSDVYAMPSLWEGLGLVFLEAMAAGLPVVSTAVSAIPEVVEHGRTGLLVPPGEVEPLAAALLELAGDPARRAALGAAGRARVRGAFGLDRMVDDTLGVYRALLAS